MSPAGWRSLLIGACIVFWAIVIALLANWLLH